LVVENGSRMQSLSRALFGSNVGVVIDHVPNASLAPWGRAPSRGWAGYKVTSGLPDVASRAVPDIFYFLASNCMLMLVPITFIAAHEPYGVRLAAAILSVVPFGCMLLRRRVALAGLLGAPNDHMYQVVDSLFPWVGRIDALGRPLFGYLWRGNAWVGYPCRRNGHHTVVVAFRDHSALAPDLPLLDRGMWRRMLWFGAQYPGSSTADADA
ncbi:MAG: hypothetical protein KJ747_04490, partial [Actinobacteria bacterium]|nr:hypothetical protein [Actinomycetota bacterium]